MERFSPTKSDEQSFYLSKTYRRRINDASTTKCVTYYLLAIYRRRINDVSTTYRRRIDDVSTTDIKVLIFSHKRVYFNHFLLDFNAIFKEQGMFCEYKNYRFYICKTLAICDGVHSHAHVT